MRWTCLLLMLLLLCTPALPDSAQQPFVAMIVTKNLQWMLHPKYHFDYEAAPQLWKEVPKCLEHIANAAGSRPIILDFYVHGNYRGLYLKDRFWKAGKIEELEDRASFGWVLLQVDHYLKGKQFTLLFESCYAGKAYHYTIRGARAISPLDNIADYPVVPSYPVYGLGDNFSGIGPMMYLQWRYGFRRWWCDLRDWDEYGKNKDLAEDEPENTIINDESYGPTTLDMRKVWQFFLQEIP